MVILQDDFSSHILAIRKGVLSLPCSLKRNMARLVSSSTDLRKASGLDLI